MTPEIHNQVQILVYMARRCLVEAWLAEQKSDAKRQSAHQGYSIKAYAKALALLEAAPQDDGTITEMARLNQETGHHNKAMALANLMSSPELKRSFFHDLACHSLDLGNQKDALEFAFSAFGGREKTLPALASLLWNNEKLFLQRGEDTILFKKFLTKICLPAVWPHATSDIPELNVPHWVMLFIRCLEGINITGEQVHSSKNDFDLAIHLSEHLTIFFPDINAIPGFIKSLQRYPKDSEIESRIILLKKQLKKLERHKLRQEPLEHVDEMKQLDTIRHLLGEEKLDEGREKFVELIETFPSAWSLHQLHILHYEYLIAEGKYQNAFDMFDFIHPNANYSPEIWGIIIRSYACICPGEQALNMINWFQLTWPYYSKLGYELISWIESIRSGANRNSLIDKGMKLFRKSDFRNAEMLLKSSIADTLHKAERAVKKILMTNKLTLNDEVIKIINALNSISEPVYVLSEYWQQDNKNWDSSLELLLYFTNFYRDSMELIKEKYGNKHEPTLEKSFLKLTEFARRQNRSFDYIFSFHLEIIQYIWVTRDIAKSIEKIIIDLISNNMQEFLLYYARDSDCLMILCDFSEKIRPVIEKNTNKFFVDLMQEKIQEIKNTSTTNKFLLKSKTDEIINDFNDTSKLILKMVGYWQQDKKDQSPSMSLLLDFVNLYQIALNFTEEMGKRKYEPILEKLFFTLIELAESQKRRFSFIFNFHMEAIKYKWKTIDVKKRIIKKTRDFILNNMREAVLYLRRDVRAMKILSTFSKEICNALVEAKKYANLPSGVTRMYDYSKKYTKTNLPATLRQDKPEYKAPTALKNLFRKLQNQFIECDAKTRLYITGSFNCSMVRNEKIQPDQDIDLLVFHASDQEQVKTILEEAGFKVKRCPVSDCLLLRTTFQDDENIERVIDCFVKPASKELIDAEEDLLVESAISRRLTIDTLHTNLINDVWVIHDPLGRGILDAQEKKVRMCDGIDPVISFNEDCVMILRIFKKIAQDHTLDDPRIMPAIQGWAPRENYGADEIQRVWNKFKEYMFGEKIDLEFKIKFSGLFSNHDGLYAKMFYLEPAKHNMKIFDRNTNYPANSAHIEHKNSLNV